MRTTLSRFISGASLAAAAVLISLGALPSTAKAQATTGPNTNTSPSNSSALRIAPVRADLVINPGETKTIDVSVTNVTDAPARLKGIVNDFGPSDDESGQPRIYLDENSSAPSRGLKKFVKPIGEQSFQAQERKTIKVAISMPDSAAGGGYYGTVRFVPITGDSSSEKNVSLTGSVGTLLLVTVPGDIIEKAAVKSFNIARQNGATLGKASNFFTNGGKDGEGGKSKGLQAVFRVENKGNVQVAPFGKLLLKKSGKELATYELNNTTPRGNVLPDSIRRFQVDLGDKTTAFGKYSLEGNFGYGSSGQLISVKTSFFVVPLLYIIGAFILVAALIGGLIVAPRLLKSHDRKLLRKVRGGGSRRK